MSSGSEGSEKNDHNEERRARDGGGGRADRQGEELATKVLSIQSKRFYLDVKQNDRGRFIKFAEVAGGGKKSRIFMSMYTSNQFKEHLSEFIDVLNDLGSNSPEGGANSPNLLHSETVVNDKRRYFLDLRENNRGRFLRITQSCTLSGTRFSIALPAQGIAQLRDALAELVSEYGEGYMDEPAHVELPEPRSLRADNKNFFFDPGHNDRGDYLKISEVKPGGRSSITVSMKTLPQMIEILTELQNKITELRAHDAHSAENTEDSGEAKDKAALKPEAS